jgi:hypothetical protein
MKIPGILRIQEAVEEGPKNGMNWIKALKNSNPESVASGIYGNIRIFHP